MKQIGLMSILLMAALLITPVDARILKARGSANLKVPADRLTLTIGVITEHQRASEALQKNSDSMNKIMEALKSTGLSQSQMQTSSFRIDPIWQTEPANPTPNWKPEIIAFKVTHNLDIETVAIRKAGGLIDAAFEAGASRAASLTFDLKDSARYRRQAITEATENAIKDAKAAANAAQVVLGDVIAITLDDTFSDTPRPFMAMRANTPIEPGDIDITAGVTVEYEIHNQ